MLVRTPGAFRFGPTVRSHGWCELPPFSYNDQERALCRVEKLDTGRIVRLRITETDHNAIAVGVESPAAPLERADIAAIRRAIRAFRRRRKSRRSR